MKEILHITPHLGAGVGKAISGIVSALSDYKNVTVLLEEPKYTGYLEGCKGLNNEVIIAPDTEKLMDLCVNADAVVFNWWAHPLSVKLLSALSKVKVRLILWAHINGLVYPIMPFDFVNEFETAMFTSPCAYDNTSWKDENIRSLREKTSVSYGMGTFFPDKQPFKNDYNIKNTFKIGYVGTLDFSKMNEKNPLVCSLIKKKIPDVSFIFYGRYTEEFKYNFTLKYPEIKDNVCFMGYSESIPERLTELDMFLYLLEKDNFATTENSLIEAMAAGLPSVVMNNPAESAIISNEKTGFIADTAEEAADLAVRLYYDKELRRKIGTSAREYTISEYDFEKNSDAFKSSIENACMLPKRRHSFDEICGRDIWDKFIYFSGRYKEPLLGKEVRELPAIFRSSSKSSPRHYLDYFPDNEKFSVLAREIEEVYNENN